LRMVQNRAYHRIRRITFTQNSPRDLQQTWDTARAFQQHVAQQQAQQDAQLIPSRKRSETVEARGNSGFDANESHSLRISGHQCIYTPGQCALEDAQQPCLWQQSHHHSSLMERARAALRARPISLGDFDLDLARSRSRWHLATHPKWQCGLEDAVQHSASPSSMVNLAGRQSLEGEAEARRSRVISSGDFDLDVARSRSIRARRELSTSNVQTGNQAAAAQQQGQQQDCLAAPWRNGHCSADWPVGQRLRPLVSRSCTSRTGRIDRSDHDAFASAQATRGGGMEGKRKAAMACIPYWDGGFAMHGPEWPFFLCQRRFSLPFREGGISLSHGDGYSSKNGSRGMLLQGRASMTLVTCWNLRAACTSARTHTRLHKRRARACARARTLAHPYTRRTSHTSPPRRMCR
jgi:hypothetical protein